MYGVPSKLTFIRLFCNYLGYTIIRRRNV